SASCARGLPGGYGCEPVSRGGALCHGREQQGQAGGRRPGGEDGGGRPSRARNTPRTGRTVPICVVPPAGFEPALPPPETGRSRDRGRLPLSYLGFLFASCVSGGLRCPVVRSTRHPTLS